MTSDELKAAAKRRHESGYKRHFYNDASGLRDMADLADYAAASLDDRPLTREWLVAVMGEPDDRNGYAWGKGGDGRFTVPDGAGFSWCETPGGEEHFLGTRADALAFFKLVRWTVEPGKILEGAKI